jgi:hypothetical protein
MARIKDGRKEDKKELRRRRKDGRKVEMKKRNGGAMEKGGKRWN